MVKRLQKELGTCVIVTVVVVVETDTEMVGVPKHRVERTVAVVMNSLVSSMDVTEVISKVVVNVVITATDVIRTFLLHLRLSPCLAYQ